MKDSDKMVVALKVTLYDGARIIEMTRKEFFTAMLESVHDDNHWSLWTCFETVEQAEEYIKKMAEDGLLELCDTDQEEESNE